jgi:protein disulfide-isomerase
MTPVMGMFAALCVVVAVSVVMKATRPDEIIPWRSNYAVALEEARANGKRAMVYFTASWCGPCQDLKHTTWADKGVEAALRDYVPVKVDIDEHPDLRQKHSVDGVPTFIVLDPTGATVHTWSGASPPGEFIQELNRLGTVSVRKTAR